MRLFLHFSGGGHRISRQLIGHIEMPNGGKPVIISEICGQEEFREKIVKFSQLGSGWLYGVLDAVAQSNGRAAVPSRYSNIPRIRINIDPEGLAKSDKKYDKFTQKFPPPKKLN